LKPPTITILLTVDMQLQPRLIIIHLAEDKSPQLITTHLAGGTRQQRLTTILLAEEVTHHVVVERPVAVEAQVVAAAEEAAVADLERLFMRI
jgi:hypothetical protein